MGNTALVEYVVKFVMIHFIFCLVVSFLFILIPYYPQISRGTNFRAEEVREN